MTPRLPHAIALLALAAPLLAGTPTLPGGEAPEAGDTVVLLGGGLGSRMLHFGHFETGLHLRYPEHGLTVRNLCDEGNTPSFRPHSARGDQLGFPGAEDFHHPYTGGRTANGIGFAETDEEWLTRLAPDTLVAFFGFSESFQGLPGLDNFRAELGAFVEHTLQQTYGAEQPARLVLVSPTAFEDRSRSLGVPDGRQANGNLAAYTQVMEAVAAEHGVGFVNAYSASLGWYADSRRPLTTDGALLNDEGYQRLATLLLDEVFEARGPADGVDAAAVRDAVEEKNWFWTNDFKIPNGVHVYGRRHDPFGPANYPYEREKLREMTALRDRAIWAALQGETLDLAALDAETLELPPVETNYQPSGKNGALEFLTGEEALATIEVPEGYRIEQWATEVEFPDLANPVQMSFDDRGRLWVATMPSYPHYRPGDPRPDDKLLILEDTDGDGRADRQTVWADDLHLPMGFEFAPEGVYLSQGTHLMLLTDTDGDDRADRREIILSGFDDHDTHHAISAYCADPSGALVMCEGVFLRTSVETAYGTVRGTDGGFYRFAPQRRHLERHAQLPIPNPWGVAFDDWGQHIFLHTSGPTTEWMLPGSVRPVYGVSTPGSRDLIEPAHRVRPTSGIEFVSSGHFPEEVQGDLLLNNTIGFLGTKQHEVMDDGAGYKTRWRQDLVRSSDGNFRPVDLEFAPDGSLYIVDWHNPLIGHMQHNARDPHRDHDHGRIYRITYPSRPLLVPPPVEGAPIAQLLDNLREHEYRLRYRTRRELRGRDPEAVLAALRTWVDGLDPSDPRHEHHRLEALWVSWGLDRIDEELLRELLASDDPRARAAAVRAVRYSGHRLDDQAELLVVAAADAHPRVQMEAITAGSWLDPEEGLAVLDAAAAVHAPAEEREDPGHVVVEDGGRRLRLTHPALAGEVTSFRLTLPGDERTINLSEMVVTSGGVDITGSLELSQSSEYNGGQYPIENLVDGDRGNFSHTAFEAEPWFEARLEAAAPIDSVELWNSSNFESRLDRAVVEFRGSSGVLTTLVLRLDDGVGIHADTWLRTPYRTARAVLEGQPIEEQVEVVVPDHLPESLHATYRRGAEIYARDGHCATCHQPDGAGLAASGFPPLAGTSWVTGDDERLIRVTLNGLMGELELDGVTYPGLVPMTPFGDLLDDDELAAVLTYVRNAFGNHAPAVSARRVAEVREASASKVGFYTPEELEGGAAGGGRSFVRLWSVEDLAAELEAPLAGRDFERGRAMFEVASCVTCHNLEGRGGRVGADLSSVGEDYSPLELLRQVVEPSAIIKPEHRLHRVELADESLYVGLIVEENEDTLVLAESLQEPERTVTVRRAEVIDREPLDLSPMPTGLLATLTREEVLDLLAYVAAGGDASSPVFGSR